MAVVSQSRSGGAAGGGGGGAAAPVATSSQNLQGLFPTRGATPTGQQQPIKTYVLSGDVTSAQEADFKINQIRKL